VNALQKQYGEELNRWQLAVPSTRFKHKNFLGIPQTMAGQQRDNIPAMNRGTQNNMTVFGEFKTPIGFEIAAPGQSGFISASGAMADHYSDQYPLFELHLKKSTRIDSKDIDQNMESETTLQFDR
jgi:penicillin amidase